MRDGTFQAGILILPLEDEELRSECVLREPLFAALSTKHRLARKRSIQIRELDGKPVVWIARQTHPAFFDSFSSWCDLVGFVPNVEQEIATVAESLAFAGQGVGVGLVKASARDTLILIGHIKTNRDEGLDPFHALVQATVQRSRPVVLTALAAVLAFIPLTFSAFWGSLAYTLIGGTAVGTLLTLIFLPALYAIWFRVKPTEGGQQTPETPIL